MVENPLLEEQRENWGSRAGFVLAAIGSAVGLGNLWGFPYKLYAYGGGAFLIPYIVAMLVIGVPVLILEFSLGHMTQRAAPEAFRRTGRRKEPIGWWGILLGFVIITYYPVILAWCISFLGQAVRGIAQNGGELPWAGMGKAGSAASTNYFLFDYCNMWRGEDVAPWSLGSLSPEIVFALAGVWFLMFLCIVRGVRVVSKIVLWTVPLPWVMLMILTVRGLTLDGAGEGLAYYLNPDWAQLLKPTTWRFAFGQVFFSMSLAFGVMVTYASFLHRKSDINNNAAIIGLGDLGTSFVAGIAVFATLGAMSVAGGKAVTEIISTQSGNETGTVGLAFMAFPYALAQLPHSAWFSLVFFFALITLGIDSAFSITESVLASIVDKTGWNRTATLWGMTFLGFVSGLVYCSRGGLSWLENIDGFINGPWGIALLGLAECVVLGWFFRLSRFRVHANERSDWKLGVWWDWNIRLVVPVVLSALFVWSLYDTVTKADGFLVSAKTGEIIVPVLVGVILAAAAPILAIVLSLFRTRMSAENTLRKENESQASPQVAMPLGAILSLFGGACVIFAGVFVIATGVGCGRGWIESIDAKVAWNLPVFVLQLVLVVGVVLAVLATIFGVQAVNRAERHGAKPHWTAQLSGALGTLMSGAGAGLGLALYVLAAKIQAANVRHTTELQTMAYVIMAVMIALLVGGIGWCLYRAVKAAAAEKADEQTAEI
ncbi:MAG: sodium-dependent transporter [Phycisphaerae bacterium]|nr:sodium-dependent transporter [Phycisphaerae bacterium]